MIHKDEYIEWTKHPVTEVFFEEINELYEAFKESVENGVDLESHAALANKIGMVRAYKSVKDYRPDFNTEGYMIDSNEDIIE